MKKKVVKQFRVVKIKDPKIIKDQDNKVLVPQVEDYISYYNLFKSLEK